MSTSTSVEGNSISSPVTCEFCDEFSGGTRNSFTLRYGDALSNRVIFTSENFKILPTLGQIVEGYLLLVPIRHYRALADIPPALTQELAKLRDQVRGALSATYGPCIFFEHGTRSDNSGGCGIYHAHLHAVPLTQGTDPITLLRQRFAFEKLQSIGELSEATDRTSSYIYYEDLYSNGYICSVDYLPSQYMRKLLAEVTSKDDWDWRMYEREEALLSAIARVAQAFSTSIGKLQSPLV